MTTPKRVLALDFGVKKMGMALGDTLTMDARPFDILSMNNGQPDWDNLLGIIQTWQIADVVVGLPLNMDGTQSMLTLRAHKFARRLVHRLGEIRSPVRVFLCDERLSSYETKARMQERGQRVSMGVQVDDVAACVLLEGYFFDPASALPVGHDGSKS